MPTYDYRCTDDGDFELIQRMADHAKGKCPTCGVVCKQIFTKPPGLDIEAMAKAGMPGAWDTVGNRITKRHRDSDQQHRPGDN